MRHWLLSLALAAALVVPVVAQDTQDTQEAQEAPAGSQDDGTFLERQIEGLLSGAGREVTVTGFRGALSSEATLERMTIADDEGVWLTLIDARLDWNRSALLGRRLEVQELTAEQIIVERLPQGDAGPDLPAAEARPFQLPDLPVSVQIGQIAIEEVTLGAPLLGEEVRISLEGSASLAGGEGNVDLAIVRLDETEGQLSLEGAFDNETGILALDLSLSEAPEGIAARLLNLPGLPSVDLSIAGEGPLSDFSADIVLATDGQERLAGEVALTAEPGAEEDTTDRSFRAEIGGDLAPVFAPEFRPFFGDDIRLRANGTAFGDGRLVLDQFALNARSLALEGTLRLTEAGAPEYFDITGRIAEPEGSGPVRLPAGEEVFVDSVALDIGFDASVGPDWTADIVLNGLDTPEADIATVTLEGSGEIDLAADAAEAVSAAIDFAARGIDLADPGQQRALGGDSVDGAVRLSWVQSQPVVLETLRIDGASFALDGAGEFRSTDTGPVASITGALQADDLSAFSALAGRDLGGAAELQIDVTAGLTSREVEVALDGRTTDLAIGIEQFDRAFAGDATLALRAARTAAGTVVEELRVTSSEVELTGDARLTSEVTEADLSFRIEDASQIDPRLSGPASITATANGTPQVIDIDVQASALGADLTWQGRVASLDRGSPIVSGEAALTTLDLDRVEALTGQDLGGIVTLTAAGEAAVDLSHFDATVALTGTGLSTGIDDLDAVLAGPVDLQLTASRAEGDEAIRIGALSLSSGAIAATGSGLYDPGASQAQIDAQVPDLSVFGRGLTGPAQISADVVESDGGYVVEADVDAFGAGLTYDGRIEDLDTDAPRVAGRATLAAFDLSRVAGLVGRPLSGRVSAEVEGFARTDLSAFNVTAQVLGNDITTGIPEADAALRGQSDVTLVARREGADALVEVERLAIDTDTLTVSASGNYAEGSSTVTLTASAPDLTPFGRGLSGPATIDATATEVAEGWDVEAAIEAFGADLTYDGRISDLDAAAPRVAGRATLTEFDLSRVAGLAGRPLSGSVAAEVEGFARTDLSTFDVTALIDGDDITTGIPEADAALRGQSEIALVARREGAESFVEVERLDIDTDTLTVSASGNYEEGASTVTLTADVPDLTPFGRGLSGPATIDASATELPEGWDLDATIGAFDASIAFDGRIDDIASGTPLVSGAATLTDLDLARIAGIVGQPLRGTVSARLDGSARTDRSAFQIDAVVNGQSVAIGNAEVDQLLAGDSRIAVSAAKEGENQPIRIATLEATTPAVSVTASGTYGAGQTDVTLSARLDNIGRFAPDFQGPVSLQGTIGEAASGRVAVNVAAEGPGGINARIAGTAATSFETVDLSVTGSAPLALANTFIEPQSIFGTARFDLAINGAPGLPALSGTVTTADARLVLPGPAIVLENLSATVQLSGGTAQVDVTGSKQAGGQFSASGSVGLTGALPVDLTVTLSQLVIEDPALYRTTANGQLRLTGAIRSGALASGTINLGETNIRVPTTGLGTAGPIPDLTHVNVPAPVQATRARAGLLDEDGNGTGDGGAGGGTSAVALDITVNAPNQIFVRGRGLDAELGGQIRITGTTANVIPSGTLELIRGRLDILGRRLDLTQGSIALLGDLQPYLRLVARTEANDITLLITLEGPLRSPEITFSSQPELPEDEVLAQLLFGKSLTAISPLQAARLASAVATLAGRGGGAVDSLRENFGLDDLDFTTDDEGNAAVRAGAYLSENIYSDVTVNAEGETEVNLNLDLTPSITARGSVGNDGETSLGIFFERDY